MRLFTFAHQGEAQVFLKKENYKSQSFYFDGLYENGQDLIIITGEGLQKTTEKVAAICTSYREKISHIMNLGIAGSLCRELTLGEIYSVRTVYKEEEFHSFTTSLAPGESSCFDCITALDRVVDDEKAAKLGLFAQIVDRELWAMGSCASLFKIPFQSYKLIADHAGSQTSCFDLREQALYFSEKIYDYFCRNLKSKKKDVIPKVAKAELPDGFYASVSQYRRFENLARKLALKWEISADQILKRIDLETLQKEEKHPKKRTSLLLKLLHQKLTPNIQKTPENTEGGIYHENLPNVY